MQCKCSWRQGAIVGGGRGEQGAFTEQRLEPHERVGRLRRKMAAKAFACAAVPCARRAKTEAQAATQRRTGRGARQNVTKPVGPAKTQRSGEFTCPQFDQLPHPAPHSPRVASNRVSPRRPQRCERLRRSQRIPLYLRPRPQLRTLLLKRPQSSNASVRRVQM
eukprot:6202201-Pleurochrysis_carterae.AAC.1